MLDKLKSLFVVEDEDATKKTNEKNEQEKAPKVEKPSSANAVNVALDKSIPKKGEGQPEEKFVNRLLNAIEQNNIEGFDYLEYKQSLQSLGGMEMDEATKFKSSLAMAKTMGATPEVLISSASHYLKVLKVEENKFQSALSNQHEKVVNGTNEQMAKLEQTIANKEKQIETLQKEIAEAKALLQKNKSGVEGNLQKINTTKQGFYAAYHIVVDQIQSDIEKMQKYFA